WLGDVQPGIVENFRTIELHDLIRLAVRMDTTNFFHHREEKIFRKGVVVMPGSLTRFEDPPAIHVKLNSCEYELRARPVSHLRNGLRCRDDEERRQHQQLLHNS